MVEKLELPEVLHDYEHVIKMLTLLFPCSTRKPLPEISTMVDRVVFVEVFRENNAIQRNRFFSDPLIKHLWMEFFLIECADTCVSHLRRIRSKPDQGELKYKTFLQDLLMYEVTYKIKMIPDKAKDPENIPVFTK